MKNILKNNKGTTMIESITGIAILLIIALMMYSGLVMGQKIMNRGDEIQNGANTNQTKMEGFTAGVENSGTVSLPFGASTITFSGNYETQTEPDNPAATLVEFKTT